MAISLTHAFTNPKADGADATIVRPSNWNAEHILQLGTGKLLGRSTAGTGVAEEITVGSGLTLAAGTLTAAGGVSGDANAFDTKAALEAATVDAGIDAINLAGYYAVGDRGGGMYIRVVSEPSHPGKIQSDDGAWWELAPLGAEVWVEQFGAQRMANYNSTGPDAWQAFEDAKTFIRVKKSSSLNATFTLRVGIGSYYLSQAFEMKGILFHFKGEGTGGAGFENQSMLRFPDLVDGIIASRANTVGRDITKYSGALTYGLGEKWYKDGNVYVVTTSGLSTTGPSGTGTGIVDGACVWDWVRAMTANEMVEIGVDGATISGFQLWSYWDGVHRGNNYTGILARTHSIRVSECNILAFEGSGIAMIADGDVDYPYPGNANNFYIGRCTAYYCGMDGIHLGYSNANAGLTENCDNSYNGRWGILDQSFLGNTHIGHHTAFNGHATLSRQRHFGSVTHDGYVWAARLECIGSAHSADYSNEPGTDPYSWFMIGGDGTAVPSPGFYPAWDALETYEPNGSYAGNNINARNVWIGLYSEQGGPGAQFQDVGTIIGGLHAAGWDYTASGMMLINNTYRSRISVGTQTLDEDGVTQFGVGLGAQSAPETPLDRNILNWDDEENNHFELKGVRGETANFDYRLVNGSSNSNVVFELTGGNSARTFGRSTNFPNGLATNRLVIGEHLIGGGRRFTAGGQPPADGDWATGDGFAFQAGHRERGPSSATSSWKAPRHMPRPALQRAWSIPFRT
jgi:hypothetical protein